MEATHPSTLPVSGRFLALKRGAEDVPGGSDDGEGGGESWRCRARLSQDSATCPSAPQGRAYWGRAPGVLSISSVLVFKGDSVPASPVAVRLIAAAPQGSLDPLSPRLRCRLCWALQRRQCARSLMTRMQHAQGPVTFLKNNQKATRVDSWLSLE